jgi:hypothetical protein
LYSAWPPAWRASSSSSFSNLADGVFILILAIIPVCIGMAVLRTHLWDIGLVVSRTLTYAVVTALLAGVYAGVVLLATDVLPFHTAVAVAVSTLAAAAAFHPLRRRVQSIVDRRFNRARYDADQAVAAFAARLQDTANPDAVHAHLLAAVHRALEPAHASVWINQQDQLAGVARKPSVKPTALTKKPTRRISRCAA